MNILFAYFCIRKLNYIMTTGNNTLKRDLGLVAAISIVIGNMVGSGIYGLPSELAKVASPSITLLAWISVSIGAIIIALSYGNLSKYIPKAGGPVVYAEAAMGRFSGYSVSLIWWLAAAIGNAAIVELMFTTIAELFPIGNDPVVKLVANLLVFWIFTYINIRGVKFAGWVSMGANVLKFFVFVLLILVAIPFFNTDILISDEIPKTLSDKSDISVFSMFSAAIALMFWAYTGLESSTMAGSEIKNPEKNIQRSVVWGLVLVMFIYLSLNVSLFVLVPQEELAHSDSPFADAINKGLGVSYGSYIINACILASLIGTLAGWIMATARSVYAASEDKFFIQSFSKLHPKYSTPYVALIVSGVITSVFFLLNFYNDISGGDKNLSHFVNITTVAAFINLPTYLITIVSEIILIKKQRIGTTMINNVRLFIAFLTSIIFLYFGWKGSVVPPVYWYVSLVLLTVGFLCYPLFIRKIRGK